MRLLRLSALARLSSLVLATLLPLAASVAQAGELTPDVQAKFIKVIVSSCGFDSFVDYYNGNITGWTQDRYMPRMKDYLGHPQDVPFDFYELIGALAPRHVFVNAPLQDKNFQWQSVDRIAAAATPVFKLLGGEGRVIVKHHDTEHDFSDDPRHQAYDFISSVLR